MKIYITTPTVNLPPNFMKLALTGWLHDHPGVKSAAMIRKGVYNDDMLYRFLNEQGIDRINWSHYFKENPHLTEYTWDLIAIRWEMPDWVVILQGEEEDERLTYAKEVADRFDFNVDVLSPHDHYSISAVKAGGLTPDQIREFYAGEADRGDDDSVLQAMQDEGSDCFSY